MKSVVFIFVPVENGRANVESAIRQHLDLPEFIEVPSEAAHETIPDANQMPLWRWFVSPK